MDKKNTNLYFKGAFLLFLVVLFFSAPIITTFDSAWYHKYSEIISGITPWSSWDFVRGVGLPLIIVVSHFLFGYSSQGMLIMMFIAFLFSNIIALKFSTNLFQTLFIVIFFTLNPFIIGYFHVFLPEPFGIFYGLVLFYILSEFKHSKWLAFYIGLILCFAHQTKESITIFLLPALLLSYYFKSKEIINTILLFSVSILVFYGANKTINSYLKKVAVYQLSVGDRSLISGVAFGNARSTLFQDRTYRSDSIILKDFPLGQETSTDSDSPRMQCLEVKDLNMFIYLRESSTIINCKYPNSISEALKINLFFLKEFPISYVKSLFLSLFEIVRLSDNRYDEVSIIGSYMYKSGMSNVIPIEAEGFDFQKYVDPYSVKSSRPVGFIAQFFYEIFSKTHIIFYSIICVLGILCVLIKLFRKKVGTMDAFVLAALVYLAFSAFIGMVNDRYFIIIFPFMVMICAKEVDSIKSHFSRFFSRLWTKRNH